MEAGESYQSNVTYICNAGLNLIGPQNLTCRADGTWSLPAPTCEGKKAALITSILYLVNDWNGIYLNVFVSAPKGCEKPKGLLHGKFQEQSLVSWKALEFFCNKGYTLQGESLVVCMGNGSWSSPFPVCTRKASSHNHSTFYITSHAHHLLLMKCKWKVQKKNDSFFSKCCCTIWVDTEPRGNLYAHYTQLLYQSLKKLLDSVVLQWNRPKPYQFNL